jgi:inward rectifier potassium channel
VTVESLVGLLGFALATGLLFARFSRPTAKIVFSERALISPYQDGTAFEFRIVNSRNNQLIEVECKVLFTRFPAENAVRQFVSLNLERSRVTFFPLSWTIVHPIDGDSPLHGLTREDLLSTEAEFLILLTGFDETFSQTVHTRSSYKATEIEWGAAFETMFKTPGADGSVRIDVGRLHRYRPASLPSPSDTGS